MTTLIINLHNHISLKEELTDEQREHIKVMLDEEKSIRDIAKYLESGMIITTVTITQMKPKSVEEILQDLEHIIENSIIF